MKISLIIACVQNLRVGPQPNFPAIYRYVFLPCSSKFTQLLTALVGIVNHILKSACSLLGQKEPFSFLDRKLSKLKLYWGRESAFKIPKNSAKKNDSSLVTTLVLSSCADYSCAWTHDRITLIGEFMDQSDKQKLLLYTYSFWYFDVALCCRELEKVTWLTKRKLSGHVKTRFSPVCSLEASPSGLYGSDLTSTDSAGKHGHKNPNNTCMFAE